MSSKYSEYLYGKARQKRKTIVLPEGGDLRVLQAAAIASAQGIAKIVVLDQNNEVAKLVEQNNINLAGVEIITDFEPYAEKFAAEFQKIRAAKGVTIEDARKSMQDISYFATMMVYLEIADGMVSGAIHSTADTIRPALQIIKTTPGSSLVSGAFLMPFETKTYIYADCAVNLNPNSTQLAEIALTTYQTALEFGIDPKVALLTYSSGDSGKGPDVDLMREATSIAKKIAEENNIDTDLFEGPIQYDAAVDADVAKIKMPNSKVAGNASVFIFPNLSCGNIVHKAVQRSANISAIGPILQGLNRPVNDLSRGALIEDIVNTIAVTAIQCK